MAQNITLLGASYSDVPAVTLPKTGGGTARFTDTTVTTAVESDVASGKIFVKADGSLGTGTASGGGGGTTYVLEELTVLQNQWNSYSTSFYPIYLDDDVVDGETYTVTWDGVDYQVQARWDDMEEEMVFGNLGSYPFLIWFYGTSSGSNGVVQATTKADHTFSISIGSGGGGGDTVFVVTLSWDSQENMYVPDCTYAQAYAAYQAGKTIAFECDEDDGYAPYCGVYSEVDSCFVYSVLKGYDSSSPSYHWGYQIYTYFWTSEGVELDDNQIVYSMDGSTATAAEIASGSYAFSTQGMVEGIATRRTSSDLTASGATVTAPAGFYASSASKAVASGTAGTPTATKGSVSNHAVTVTPSVTNTTGFITGSTKTGTGVSVSASELVSGSETKTANGTYDVTNLAELVVAVPSPSYSTIRTGSTAPSSSLGVDGDVYIQV